MDWKLELVVVPVSDVDRARTFYAEKAGFNLDVDHRARDDFRVVQLTPPARRARSPLGRGSRARRRAPSRACTHVSDARISCAR